MKGPRAYTVMPANVKFVLEIRVIETVFTSLIVFYVGAAVTTGSMLQLWARLHFSFIISLAKCLLQRDIFWWSRASAARWNSHCERWACLNSAPRFRMCGRRACTAVPILHTRLWRRVRGPFIATPRVLSPLETKEVPPRGAAVQGPSSCRLRAQCA